MTGSTTRSSCTQVTAQLLGTSHMAKLRPIRMLTIYPECSAVAAELIGVLLFSLLGGTAPAQLAPWANGFALAVLIYVTANISGGHLNPVWAGQASSGLGNVHHCLAAGVSTESLDGCQRRMQAVTVATLITGHITIVKALLYVLAQISGAIMGHLLQVGPLGHDEMHEMSVVVRCCTRTSIPCHLSCLWNCTLLLACNQAALVPQCSVGETGASPGVFTPGLNVAGSQVFGWELILTFILVTCFSSAVQHLQTT